MDSIRQSNEDEIDLAELFIKLWAYKFFIIILTSISICLGIYHIAKTDKIYTSSSIFVLDQKSEPSLLDGLTNNIVRIALPKIEKSGVETLIERITERDFILELDKDLDFRNDKYFNNYDPNHLDPVWKTTIKSLLNWKSKPLDFTNVADWHVVGSFKSNVKISETKAGAIKISVQHFDAERAAKIANHIAVKTMSLIQQEKINQSNNRLAYLSQNLADSLIRYENAEKRLKNFALSNSTASLLTFNKGSILLDDLRSQREKAKTQIQTIDVLLSLSERKSPTTEDYLKLRNNYRILDQSEFRRILGISEVLSAWSWPSAEKLSRIRESIDDRVGSLESEIDKLEADAKRYALSAEEMQRLRRDLKIEEATYKVLTEQVKALSLSAGFTPDQSKIIASAAVPIAPSKPNRNLILALAMVLGFFVSCLLALILSSRSGCCYSEKLFLRILKPKFTHKIRSIRGYRSKNLKSAQDFLNKRPIGWLRQVLVESTVSERPTSTLVIDTTSYQYASTLSRVLGISAHEIGLTVAYIDLSKRLQYDKNKQNKVVSQEDENLIVLETINGCTEYDFAGGKQNAEIFFSKSFKATLDHLEKTHDLVLMSADHDILDLLYTLRTYRDFNLVVHVSKGKTKFETIDTLNKKGNVEVALLT